MSPSEGNWIQWLRDTLREWHDWFRPSMAAAVLVAVGTPVILFLALSLGGGADDGRSVRTTGAEAEAVATAEAAVPAIRHAPNAPVAKLEGKTLTVAEVKALVKTRPKEAAKLRFNNDVTLREATALLGRKPTKKQLPKPKPEPAVTTTTRPPATTTPATTTPATTSTVPGPTTTSEPKVPPTTTTVPPTTVPPTTVPPTTTTVPDTTTTVPDPPPPTLPPAPDPTVPDPPPPPLEVGAALGAVISSLGALGL